MKKIIITALLAALTLSLCACEKQDTTNNSSTSSTTNSIVFDVDDSEEVSSADTDSTSTSSNSESSSKSSSKSSSESSSESSKSHADVSSKDTSSKQQITPKNTVSKKDTSSAEVSSAQDTDSEDDVIPIEIESEPTGFESQISGSWSARKILDGNGNEVSGEELYGSSYRIYGGAIEFSDDGTFSLRMGVSSDDATSQGTFTYESGTDIQLHFYDDSISSCTIENIDGTDTIKMPFDIFGDTFTVYFTLEY